MWNVQVPHNAWTPALFGSLGLKRSDPSFRCHSKGLAEKFDECARLPIADLGSNRLHSTSLNQQLYSFHQTHLSSPKLVARPNFSAQRPERWSVLLICHKGSSKPRALESSGSVTNVAAGLVLGKASASKPRVACGFGVVFRRESKPQDEEVSARGSYPQRFP